MRTISAISPLMKHKTNSFSVAGLRPLAAALTTALFTLAIFRPAVGAEADAGPIPSLKLLAEGFSAPSVLVSIPDGSGRLLVAEQAAPFISSTAKEKSPSNRSWISAARYVS